MTDRREQSRHARLEPAGVNALQQPRLLDSQPVRARPLAEGLRGQQRNPGVRGRAADVEIEQQLLLAGQPAAQVRVSSRGAVTELARDPGARDPSLLAAVGAPREPVNPPRHGRERELHGHRRAHVRKIDEQPVDHLVLKPAAGAGVGVGSDLGDERPQLLQTLDGLSPCRRVARRLGVDRERVADPHVRIGDLQAAVDQQRILGGANHAQHHSRRALLLGQHVNLERDRRGAGQDPAKPAAVQRRGEGLEDLRHPLGRGDVVAVGNDLVALAGGGATRAGAQPCRQQSKPTAQRRQRDHHAEHESDQQPAHQPRPQPRLGRRARVRVRCGRALDGVGADHVTGPKRRGGARGVRLSRVAAAAGAGSARARRGRGGGGVNRGLGGGVGVRAQRVKRGVHQPIGARAGREHGDDRDADCVPDQRPAHARLSVNWPSPRGHGVPGGSVCTGGPPAGVLSGIARAACSERRVDPLACGDASHDGSGVAIVAGLRIRAPRGGVARSCRMGRRRTAGR